MTGNSQSTLFTEGMFPLSQAARLIPSIRRTGPVSTSCVWRWIHQGIELPDGRVIRLEAQRFCGRWVTSRQAIERFIIAQQQPTPSGAEAQLPDSPPSPAARRRQVSLAEQELINEGL